MFRKKKTAQQLQKEKIEEEIIKTRLLLDCAYSNFQNSTDPDLIDCSIYQMNAAQQRYKVLLRQAKQLFQTEDIQKL